MAFIIKKGSNYFWPVKHKTPATGGKYDTQTFDAEFKGIPAQRLKEILKDESATDEAFCREIVVGWRGVQDEGKAEIPFSESAFSDLLECPGLATSIVSAYLESIAGQKVKN